MAFQRNRGYNLIVGDYKQNQAINITDLQITFDCSKTSNNTERSDSCTIEIYNLSETSLKYFEGSYVAAAFDVGYKEIGLKRLFSGEINQVTTRKSGTDRVTQIVMGSGYVALNHTMLNKVVPAGKTVQDVIDEIRKQMPGVVRGIYAGTNISNPVLYGYPLTGTPKEMLQELSRANQVEWRVDGDSLYVNDTKGVISKDTAFVFSKDTGLIEVPYKTYQNLNGQLKKGGKKLNPNSTKESSTSSTDIEAGIQFKSLLNPEVLPGSIIEVKSNEVNGFYKVDSLRYFGDYRGNDFYMECFCSSRLGDSV